MNLVCLRRNHMTYKVARTGLVLILALLIAVPFPLLAQDKTSSDTQTTSSASDASTTSSNDATSKDKKKDKDKDKKDKDKKKPKNADVDNIGSRNINKGSINFISLDKEIAMGRQLAAEVERQVKLIDDPTVTEYVNRVGQNIVRNSDSQVPFTIKVIDSDEINAFALPGGFFYVNSGLILAADEEAELAGVMAHEIAHVAACHAARENTRGNIMSMATIPLIFVGGGIGYAGYEAASLALPMTFLKFSRNFESEADYLGLQYMYKSGYDPDAFISFFEKVQAQEKRKPGTLAKAFSTHPQTPDRIEKSQDEISKILPARSQYIVTTSEFDDVKSRLAAIENRHKIQDQKDNNKPSLRRTTSTDKTSQDGQSTSGDDHPTLKRRPDDPNN